MNHTRSGHWFAPNNFCGGGSTRSVVKWFYEVLLLYLPGMVCLYESKHWKWTRFRRRILHVRQYQGTRYKRVRILLEKLAFPLGEKCLYGRFHTSCIPLTLLEHVLDPVIQTTFKQFFIGPSPLLSTTPGVILWTTHLQEFGTTKDREKTNRKETFQHFLYCHVVESICVKVISRADHLVHIKEEHVSIATLRPRTHYACGLLYCTSRLLEDNVTYLFRQKKLSNIKLSNNNLDQKLLIDNIFEPGTS